MESNKPKEANPVDSIVGLLSLTHRCCCRIDNMHRSLEAFSQLSLCLNTATVRPHGKNLAAEDQQQKTQFAQDH